MSIVAQYGGKCLTCGKYIPAGEKVMYEPGRGIRHPRGGCKLAADTPQPTTRPAQRNETLGKNEDKVIGRATYKGHDYLLLWEGTTSRGTRAARLVFRDGSKIFWADAGSYSISKRYREPLSIADLDRYAAEHREQEKDHSRPAESLTPEQRLERAPELAAKAGVVVTGAEARSYTAREDIVRVGDTRKTKKDGWVLVVALGRYDKYYHSEDACEDQDCFCGHYGWREEQEYFGVQCSEPARAKEAREAKEAARTTEQAKTDAIIAAFAAAKAAIPGDYKSRHGAMIGGTVTMSSESGTWTSQITPVACGFLQSAPAWEQVASDCALDQKYGHGDTLYRCVLSDRRPVFRITHIQYDDYRETYYFPEDVWLAVTLAEIHQRGITRQQAEEWLDQYRGCVGTDVYELAAAGARTRDGAE